MSAGKTLEFVVERREELRDQQAAATIKFQEAKAELTAIEREERALNALERAMKPEPTGTRIPSAEIRKSIMTAVAGEPSGLTAAEIIEALAARGNKVRQDAVRNALHAMKKPRAGKPAELLHDGGRYFAPAAKTEQEPTTQATKAG